MPPAKKIERARTRPGCSHRGLNLQSSTSELSDERLAGGRRRGRNLQNPQSANFELCATASPAPPAPARKCFDYLERLWARPERVHPVCIRGRVKQIDPPTDKFADYSLRLHSPFVKPSSGSHP